MPKRNIFKENKMESGTQMKKVKTTGVAENQQQFDPVIGRAVEVFANEQKALRWLGTPVRALEFATPISLLGRPEGRSAVLKVLDKIEHGVL